MRRGIGEFLRRGIGTSPRALARWGLRQWRGAWDRRAAPRRERRLTPALLLRSVDAEDLDGLWRRLSEGPFPATVRPVDPSLYERLAPGDGDRIRRAARAALDREVDLLGSGTLRLGRPVDWHRDHKSGHGWPRAYFRDLDLLDLERPSDVKFPWELSRLQWLIPAGQAFLLDREEAYAQAARDLIAEWIDANPLAMGVNWACPMDVALRAMTLVWLFHVFHDSAPWRDAGFRAALLKSLFLHGDFVARHLEWSDVNGNHLLADAAGLAVLGEFFERGRKPRAWRRLGWAILTAELPRQVREDGVSFEGSAAYHRLSLELFLWPALCRRAAGRGVDAAYRRALIAMARFVQASADIAGRAPLWGDGDDGRALPFGGQAIGDHRHAAALVGLAFDDAGLVANAADPGGEVFWTLGPEAMGRIPKVVRAPGPAAFKDSGAYILRGPKGDWVFLTCGPVAFAGRGGHGHNDSLSFEAALGGRKLITDCGSYLYSASIDWRNRMRGTAAHNTPMIDGEEQNRFVRPEYLWTLRNDAAPEPRRWETTDGRDIFVGAHSGYLRLPTPVTPVRGVLLDKRASRLAVVDRFEGGGDHRLRIPFHLAPGVEPIAAEPDRTLLEAAGRRYALGWLGAGEWQCGIEEAWCAPSYGVKLPIRAVVFERTGPLAPLAVALFPDPEDGSGWRSWLEQAAVTLFPDFALS